MRWGFLGAGEIARTALAPAVHTAPNAVLQAVAARDVTRARALRPRAAYGAYDDVLADPDVEAVYISLTNEVHVPWARRALGAGKAVLCEKPLGLTAAEVGDLAADAAATGLLAAEASCYQWHPRIRRAADLLAGGTLGAVRHVTGRYDADVVLPPQNYRWSPARGGGALYDVGCYPLSAAQWAFGGQPVRVSAERHLGGTGVDITTDAVLEWGCGRAEIACGFGRLARQELVVDCAEGRIEVPDQPYSLMNRPAELWITDRGGRRTEQFPPVDPYRAMVEAFCDALRGRPGWVLPLDQSRACAAATDAIIAARR